MAIDIVLSRSHLHVNDLIHEEALDSIATVRVGDEPGTISASGSLHTPKVAFGCQRII